MYSSNIMKSKSKNSGSVYAIPEFSISDIVKAKIPKNSEKDAAKEPVTAKGVSESIISKAHDDAFDILQEAKEKAEEIIQQAKIRSEEIFEQKAAQGIQKGYELGIEKAKAEAEKKIEKAMEELTALSDNLVAQRQNFLQANKNIIVDIAIDVAGKIASESFATNKDIFYNMFEHVVKDVKPADKLIITVAEKDYRLMTYDMQRLQKIAQGFTKIEIRPDQTAEKGTLRLETSVMLIDASLNTQIGLLKKDIGSVLE